MNPTSERREMFQLQENRTPQQGLSGEEKRTEKQ
jgi:hypothetical protein